MEESISGHNSSYHPMKLSMYRNKHKKILNCLAIGKVWYGIFITILQIYTHYSVISSYVSFKEQLNNPRYGLDWNEAPMNFQLFVTAFSLSLMPFFIYSCLFKTGNLINDDIRLGDDKINEVMIDESYLLRSLREQHFNPSLSQKLAYYLCPSSQIIHFVSAFMLLIPSIFIEAERYKNSALHNKYLWISDIHAIFNINSFQGTLIIHSNSESLGFPISTINFIVASIFLSLQTSKVFSKISKQFTVITALYDSFVTISILFLQSSLRVSIRYFMPRVDIDGSPVFSYTDPLFSQIQCCTFIVISFIIYLISRNLMFYYGTSQFVVSQRSYNEYVEESRLPSISTGLVNKSKDFQDKLRGRLQNSWINISLFCLWIIQVGFVIPLSCFFINSFWKTQNEYLITGFVASLIQLIVWFLLIMILAIRQNWSFKVTRSSQGSIVSQNNNNNTESTNSEAIYTCFQDNRTFSPLSNKYSHVSNPKLNNNNADSASEAHSNSDLYQLFKIPTPATYNNTNGYYSMTPTSSFNIQTNDGIYQMRPVSNTKSPAMLNGINENYPTLASNKPNQYAPHFNSHDTLDHKSIMSRIVQQNIPGNLEESSDYHSNSIQNIPTMSNKHFSMDSLKSFPSAHTNNGQRFYTNSYTTKPMSQLVGSHDNYNINNIMMNNHNSNHSNNQINFDDTNTDISTDFSDRTNSSSVEKTNSVNSKLYSSYRPQIYEDHNPTNTHQTGV